MGAATPRKKDQDLNHFIPSNPASEIKENDDPQVPETINWLLYSNNYQALLSQKAQIAFQAIWQYNGQSKLFVNKLEKFEVIDKETQQFKFRGQRRVKDKIIEGHGVQLEKRVFYQGYFLAGLKHYFGKEIQDDGSYYFGDFLSGMKHGQGFLSVQNTIGLGGEFLNNLFDGCEIHMKQKNLQKLEYKGEFENGQFILGTINGFNPNNQLILSYKGESYNFKMHGKGELSKNRIIYKGEFKENYQHGKGRQYDEDQKGYRKGEWVQGKKQGKFIYKREGTQSVEEYHRDQRK